MNESFARELQKHVADQVKKLREWIKPVPTDPLGLKIVKGFFKSLVVLVLIIFSPVICLLLTIAFLAAF